MTQEEYEVLVDMFTSEGWKYFTESLSDMESTLTTSAPGGAVTNDQMEEKKVEV